MNEPYEGQIRWFVIKFEGGMTGEPQLQQYHNGQWHQVKVKFAMVEEDAKSSREWACVGLFLVALVGYNTVHHVLMLRALI